LSTGGNPPPLLDPFAGGGSIPLEAQRLGLEAHASDLNPVAVMINKAMIEIPPKFADMPPVNPDSRKGTAAGGSWKGAAGLAADVRYYGEWMRNRAYKKIGHLYPEHKGETVIAWLWARTVQCPNPACGAQMPLVRSFWLSKKKGKKAWVVPEIDKEAKTVRFTVQRGNGEPPDPPKVGRGAKFRCLVCCELAPDQHLKDEGMAGRMGAKLMAIVTEGKNGRSYYAPTAKHERIASQAKPTWEPQGELAYEPRAIWCKSYGIIDFADLFTPRQLAALTTFSDLVAEARNQIRTDAIAAGLSDDEISLRDNGRSAKAYAEAVSVYVAFAIDKATDYWSTIATWMPRGTVGHVFARQGIPMVWDYPEANPFADFHCAWLELLEWVIKAINTLKPKQPSFSIQQDAKAISNDKAIPISTDPPYYDNIGYADLSDYFYVWLRPNLKQIYPDLFGTLLVPKTTELVASPYRFDGDSTKAEEHFESGLMQTFSIMRDIIPPEYPLSVYYAFKQEEIIAEEVASTGWETMLNGLIDAGFSIVGTWPMRTERSARSVSIGANSLASSIVLICRPRSNDSPITSRREFVNGLRQELPPALREMQSGNIAPVDLAQASIGPGMAVYSRYAKVLEPNGDRLTVRTALQLINQELDAYLAEQEGHIDADSRFAVAWFQQYGFEKGPFGQADVLARAKNTSVAGMSNAGVLESGAGKVRLLHWSEFDPGWDPSKDERLPVWEATHHLIERLNSYGEEGVARLLAKMSPELAADARQLAYRLYSICERKSWSEHARDYNALVVSWSASQEQASEFKQYEQGSLF
jgi:putative DNA methylase